MFLIGGGGGEGSGASEGRVIQKKWDHWRESTIILKGIKGV